MRGVLDVPGIRERPYGDAAIAEANVNAVVSTME
jgi:hypothetical protein